MIKLQSIFWLATVQAIIILSPYCSSAQTLRDPDQNRYVLWFTPTGRHSVKINGLAVGLFSEVPGNEGQLRINGVNVEVLPFAAIMVFGATFYTMGCVFDDEMLPETPRRYTTEIHGFSLSAGMLEEVHTNGLTWNFLSYVGNSRGVELSMVMNSNYEFSGVQGALFGNRAVAGKGFQLGMFNTCQDCDKIVQLGFLNRIGDRVLPIINLRFGKGSDGSKRRRPSKSNR